MLQARGKHIRKLTTTGEQTVQLSRRYGYCPICQVGFFPCTGSLAHELRNELVEELMLI